MAWVALVASGLGLLAYLLVSKKAGHVPAMLSVAVVVLLHAAVAIAVWQRIGRRWRLWRRRLDGREAAAKTVQE